MTDRAHEHPTAPQSCGGHEVGHGGLVTPDDPATSAGERTGEQAIFTTGEAELPIETQPKSSHGSQVEQQVVGGGD